MKQQDPWAVDVLELDELDLVRTVREGTGVAETGAVALARQNEDSDEPPRRIRWRATSSGPITFRLSGSGGAKDGGPR